MSDATTREQRAVELLRRLYGHYLGTETVPADELLDISDFLNPRPDYGEPWFVDREFIASENGLNLAVSLGDTESQYRIVACVNACRGMRDPEREIAALRAAADAAKAK